MCSGQLKLMPGKGNCEKLEGEDLLGGFPCKLLFVDTPPQAQLQDCIVLAINREMFKRDRCKN